MNSHILQITYISVNGSEIAPLASAFRELRDEMSDILSLHPITGESLSQTRELEVLARRSDLVIIRLHGGKKSLPGFDGLVRGSKALLYVQDSSSIDPELVNLSTVGDNYRKIFQYISFGGRENLRNLLLFLANWLGKASFPVCDPKMPAWEGIYHPAFDHVPSLEEYLEKKILPGRLTVGLWFNISMWQAEDLQVIDYIITEVEARGANVIPVFLHTRKDEQIGSSGWENAIKKYFMKDGRPLIDVLISTLVFSLTIGPESAASSKTDDCDRTAVDGSAEYAPDEVRPVNKFSILQELDVPILKAMLNYYETREDWAASFQGLKPMDVTINVAQPEFDGMLISVPVGFRDRSREDPLTGSCIYRFEPEIERIQKLVRLALNWAKLRHTPPQDRKVAIIFHNYPPRDDQIGTAIGLDSPQSVCSILSRMAEDGYRLDWLPQSCQDLMERILKGATNQKKLYSIQWLQKMADATVLSEQYKEWFEELPASVQERMRNNWGGPPGEQSVHNGVLMLPGIVNGNVFISMQPPRGLLENAEAIYHSPDLPIPHQYYAYYRWIREIFGAHVVMHIGKHGSLEWLPGKSVGLSSSCYPDIAISDLPNIYPYIINNPDEGTQAKRRSYCCLVDHLVPAMRNADAYEEMAELEVLIKEYRHAFLEDPRKLPDLKERIWQKTREARLDSDLGMADAPGGLEFDDFIAKLGDYIYELSDSQVRNGLHILGQPPSGSKQDEFLVSLTRLKNGRVPSLREAVADLMGYDYDHLMNERARTIDGQKTGAEILQEIHHQSLRLIEELHNRGFSQGDIERVQIEVLGKKTDDVQAVLRYICESLVPRLEETTQELDSILNAARGGYVMPGPSGAPTRGMADILPTGRNFYSLDPRVIPTRAAWKVGVMQAESLLERYIQDEGKYPENIGIILWSSNTMRTRGDEVAEILYLMGVRPVWEDRNGRIDGLELISLQELGRPRIDVTMRISGIFRDAFPNIVELMDDAVQMVSCLEESPDENYLAHHVALRMKEKMNAGICAKSAREEASYRIFGSRPGTYGAGVSAAVESKSWKSCHDLAEVYVVWGGYAYGRKSFGATAPEEFRMRLGSLDLTVKNEDTREIDMLDGDDFYSFHGGMIAAVASIKGEPPRSYCADSSDPERIKTRSAAEETKHIFRTRILNPKWIMSMQEHGYKGAADFARAADMAFGWDATAEVLEDWMYEELANKYALDEEMQEWLKDVNPHALQNITERLLEAVERGMWQATEEMRESLRRIYLEVEGMLEDETLITPEIKS
ncbi:MAG: cobaltochelatase subunit CobN [Methanosaeta sp. PtaU1.Bin060]|nr:MAG: cobaltochelatase subunit CobN [Methanosaeta sp. PtaU1.Bin060]